MSGNCYLRSANHFYNRQGWKLYVYVLFTVNNHSLASYRMVLTSQKCQQGSLLELSWHEWGWGLHVLRYPRAPRVEQFTYAFLASGHILVCCMAGEYFMCGFYYLHSKTLQGGWLLQPPSLGWLRQLKPSGTHCQLFTDPEICSQLLSSFFFQKPSYVWSLTSMIFILVFT